MQIHFLRHASLVVGLAGRYILVDPMLSPLGAMPPVANAADQRPIPLVDLPLEEVELHYMLEHVDAALVTHTHRDHWDAQAVDLLPKDLPIICQPADTANIQQAGFTAVGSGRGAGYVAGHSDRSHRRGSTALARSAS